MAPQSTVGTFSEHAQLRSKSHVPVMSVGIVLMLWRGREIGKQNRSLHERPTGKTRYRK